MVDPQYCGTYAREKNVHVYFFLAFVPRHCAILMLDMFYIMCDIYGQSSPTYCVSTKFKRFDLFKCRKITSQFNLSRFLHDFFKNSHSSADLFSLVLIQTSRPDFL